MQGLMEGRPPRPAPRTEATTRSAVCVSADDYGISPGTNAAIEALVRAGKVDAVSVMAHREASLGSVRALRDAGVPIGLHLCFTGSASFPRTYRGLCARFLSAPLTTLRAIETEAEIQVERLLSNGIPVAFLNGHEHVHLLPMVWPVVARLARRLEVRAVRSAIGQPFEWSSAGLLAASSRIAWQLSPLDGVEALSPLGVGLAGSFTIDAIDRALARPIDGSYVATRELCMHPSFDDAGRRAEYDLIASGKLSALLDQRELVTRSP
ncbi:MAG: ChbG/HpnK family deacetylase [Polyangiales bacterium]